MPLAAGNRLGPYEIVAPLGAGGMGEVYRARDTRLGRDVAVKVLPERLAHDAEALERFEREARAVAALSHPNLIALHDFVRQDTTAYAVTELLAGETLRARLISGPLPVRRAIDYATQVAQGLAAAHEKGIVHRDLKPENLFVTGDGRVKILDFGLARRTALTTGDDTSSPTVTHHTEPGVLLGTVAYMAPEQVRGRVADARSDIFAFGVVLYEMLSGRRPFRRETAAETMAAILTEDPPDLSAEVPAGLAQIVDHCLAKDPAARVSSARDLAFDLQLVGGLSSGRAGPALWGGRRLGSSWAWLGGAVVGALVAALIFHGLGRPRIAENRDLVSLSLNLPATLALTLGDYPTLAFSPDGRSLVYRAHIGRPKDGRLYLRRLGEQDARPLDGTESAVHPFFSPDGQWLGFDDVAAAQLKAVPLAGGAVRTICATEDLNGASWGEDGRIVFAPGLLSPNLVRVAAEGGVPEPLTTLDRKTEDGHFWPQVLPGGKAMLFTIETPGRPFDDARIVGQDIATGRRSVVVEGGTGGRYLRSGHVVYARGSSLMAIRFDLGRMAAVGAGIALVEGVHTSPGGGLADFAVSNDGTLAYVPAPADLYEHSLVWVDRRGNATPATTTRALYAGVAASLDAHRMAVELSAANNDIWLLEPSTGALTRLTFDHENEYPLWTPDGHLLFASDRDGAENPYIMRADGTEVRRLAQLPRPAWATSVSPDGETLLLNQAGEHGGYDIGLLSLRQGGQSKLLVETPFSEHDAMFSPDGRWIAYVSEESGRAEVYVQPFPGPGSKSRVSLDGGDSPAWSRDGKELFFVQGTKMMTSRLTLIPGLSSSKPEVLFDAPWRGGKYVVAPDGRFLTIRLSEAATSTREIRVVLNWFEELKRRLPN
jgi:Tol biopolymer transport system component